jgi:uroporphyrinogen-III synthase
VALLESRQARELAATVSRLGGVPFSAPAVQERPSLDDAGPALDRLVGGAFSLAIALTGAGVTALFAEAHRRGRSADVQRAMRLLTIVSRGPKPLIALKQHGLSAGIVTAKPHTTQELLEALTATHLESTNVMLLHYGERNRALVDALTARGALVEDVCLYEWTLPEDVAPLHEVVARTIAGEIDALLVTSQIQFRFLLEVAEAAGAREQLVQALNEHVVVGAIGPVCAAALRANGIVPDVLPASPNNASLIGAVADYFQLTAHREDD